MASVAQLLRYAPLLADGAIGTLLHARGFAADSCIEALSLTRPREIGDIHDGYIAAGAQVICTNTFAANRLRLRAHGLDGELEAINAAAARLARESAERAEHPIFVAGDVGPLGVNLAPYGRLRPEQAFETFSEQIEVLVRAGVDLLLLETFADVRELVEAVRAAHEVASLPVIATMTFTRDDRTLLGETAAGIADALVNGGANFVGVNCAGGPAQSMRLLRAMRTAVPSALFAVKPNAGWPEQIGGRCVYPATPAYFARYALDFADAGASIIGGCCGTTPEHIAAMHEALAVRRENRSSVAETPKTLSQSAVELQIGQPGSEVLESDANQAVTNLAGCLRAGDFVVTVEMSPPKGHSVQALLVAARLLKDAGADAVNVADSPRARMRMSPWALCHRIQQDVGIDAVLHFPLRGRNLLRVQGDLLAAHALGIRNLFAVMGDPTAIGDHPSAMDAYDLVPSGLIRLVKHHLNAGVDQAGADIGEPTSFFVGCALNLAAADTDLEIRSLHRKIEAGTDFVLTQPVFDPAFARVFLDRYRERHGAVRVPVICGVLPLYGERHATFLHNEVPGISIPIEVRTRVAAGGREEGVRVALEIARSLRHLVQGIYLMPPFSRWDMAAEIIEQLKA